jgi:hypothetical protein
LKVGRRPSDGNSERAVYLKSNAKRSKDAQEILLQQSFACLCALGGEFFVQKNIYRKVRKGTRRKPAIGAGLCDSSHPWRLFPSGQAAAKDHYALVIYT